ncbi:hypothetical protein BO85DRAFT_504970 [Aspergillus piperis CBS 112811]|uniref:Uncharacterized protein n=1 Tax=Aspergillus piperis CBS 112811 TaxID=1448313 RepID=A0A8G1QVA7_9EURO|nr:hypothetical protein BO85DRAFT_504970 [Aspergillus piperis CBS 112811]RAH53264.1 hypothetical protein BO85DRAFT_504970 [Aspergillus piperis CBS 112811]
MDGLCRQEERCRSDAEENQSGQPTNQQGKGIGMTNAAGYQSGKLTMWGEINPLEPSRRRLRLVKGGVGFRDLQRTGWRAKQGGGGGKGKEKKKGTEHRVAQRLNGLHEGPLSTQTAPETQ